MPLPAKAAPKVTEMDLHPAILMHLTPTKLTRTRPAHTISNLILRILTPRKTFRRFIWKLCLKSREGDKPKGIAILNSTYTWIQSSDIWSNI